MAFQKSHADRFYCFSYIFFYNSTRLAFRLRSFIHIRELSGQLKILVS